MQGAVLQPLPLWYGLAPFGLHLGTSKHLASGLYMGRVAFAGVKLQVAQRWRSDRQPQVALAGPRSTLPLAPLWLPTETVALGGRQPRGMATHRHIATHVATVGHQHHSRLRSCASGNTAAGIWY